MAISNRSILASNPLLNSTGLPQFSSIKPAHILPALEHLLAEGRETIATLLQNVEDYQWQNFIEPMCRFENKLSLAWSPVSHLHSVMDSEALRKAYDACLPLLTEYATEMGQNKALYRAYQMIKKNHWDALDKVQQKIIDDSLQDFKLAGVSLEGEAKKRYGEIKKRLSELTNKFEQNILDATMAWSKNFADAAPLQGLPEMALSQAKQTAANRDESGYSITLEFPSYYSVISYATDRKLREEMYQAYSTRASEQGPYARQFDNSQIMDELLKLRHELAQLLDFKNYAELSLATKMAQSPQQVFDFLNDLAKRSLQQAQQDKLQLQQFAQELDGIEAIEPWDVAYYSEKLREKKYAISQEQLRPYFPEDKVIAGLFEITGKLYSVSFKENKTVSTWHPDVRYFEIYNADQKQIASFYLDLYARPHKRGGAWMDSCQDKFKLSDGSTQLPIAFLTTNFNGPTENNPALLTHDDVVTLFHEFGHGLHHMLTEIDYPQVSGISGVPWDAVELPSQFSENFCYQAQTLKMISGHYQTHEPLSDEMIEKILAAKNFQSAMMMVRQLEFSLFDFHMYHDYSHENPLNIQQTLNKIRSQVAVIQPPAYNRFQHGFSHIFSGGYAAGYYSYKWAEVLSADAFSKFEQEGVLNSETGQAFLKKILSRGGSEEPMDLFIAFMGREPEISALLRHSGIHGA